RHPVRGLALAIGNIGMSRVGQDGAGPAGRRQEVVMGGAVQRPSGGAVRRKVGYGVGGEGGPRSRGGGQEASGDGYQREFAHRTPSRILGNGCFILHRGRTPRSSQSTTKSSLPRAARCSAPDCTAHAFSAFPRSREISMILRM